MLRKARRAALTGDLEEKLAVAEQTLRSVTSRRSQSIWNTEANVAADDGAAELKFNPMETISGKEERYKAELEESCKVS